MKLTDVQRIAGDVAREQDNGLEVVGAVPAAGESTYTEVILTIRGCSDEPCLLVVGVSRDSPEHSVRTTIAARLREHLQTHSAGTATRRSSR